MPIVDQLVNTAQALGILFGTMGVISLFVWSMLEYADRNKTKCLFAADQVRLAKRHYHSNRF